MPGSEVLLPSGAHALSTLWSCSETRLPVLATLHIRATLCHCSAGLRTPDCNIMSSNRTQAQADERSSHDRGCSGYLGQPSAFGPQTGHATDAAAHTLCRTAELKHSKGAKKGADETCRVGGPRAVAYSQHVSNRPHRTHRAPFSAVGSPLLVRRIGRDLPRRHLRSTPFGLRSKDIPASQALVICMTPGRVNIRGQLLSFPMPRPLQAAR